ncbi:GNAT family N-acetyltransferase [Paracidovorax avenae]|uniref:GNAT family N-acetyltransferase n=1 Tax=Paracidovorax avenae TaxID=80867 RepID=UPI0018650CE6
MPDGNTPRESRCISSITSPDRAGRHSLYLEHLYASPEYSAQGIGKTLLLHLNAIAVEKDGGRFE